MDEETEAGGFAGPGDHPLIACDAQRRPTFADEHVGGRWRLPLKPAQCEAGKEVEQNFAFGPVSLSGTVTHHPATPPQGFVYGVVAARNSSFTDGIQAVLMPAYHHGVEVEAVRRTGAEVVFYRVDRAWNADLDDVEAKIAGAGSAARVFYPGRGDARGTRASDFADH